jgi:hypothetical protein
MKLYWIGMLGGTLMLTTACEEGLQGQQAQAPTSDVTLTSANMTGATTSGLKLDTDYPWAAKKARGTSSLKVDTTDPWAAPAPAAAKAAEPTMPTTGVPAAPTPLP